MKINYEQIVTTIVGGYIGALIPNNNYVYYYRFFI